MVMYSSDINEVQGLQMEALIIDEETCSSLRHLVPRVEGMDRCDILKVALKFSFYRRWQSSGFKVQIQMHLVPKRSFKTFYKGKVL